MIIRSLLLLTALALAKIAVAQTAAETEIVVTAQVERIGLTLGRNEAGATTCGLTRSSGDIAIDSAMCKRAAHCVKPGEIDRMALEACLAKQKTALIAAWLKGERS